MRFYKNLIAICFCFILTLSLALSACKSSAKADPVAPFSEIGWASTLDDIIAAEGDGYDTYDSTYGGLCYTWPKEYNGHEGTIKYMLDENDALMCIAWAYGAEDAESLDVLYQELYDSVSAENGDSTPQSQGVGNYGDVWYRDAGSILLTVMVTAENHALQYAYMNPVVSSAQ